jgi:DNA-binding transcriptional MocR family regulator
MAEFSIDPYVERYAARTSGMTASEVRALFAVASRPEVISLAGGMPYVQALPTEDVLAVVEKVIRERGALALQYGGGLGQVTLREQLAGLMAEEGIVGADPEQICVTVGGTQALDILGKIFLDAGDEIVVEAPTYVGTLSAFSAYEPRILTVGLDDEGMKVDELESLLVGGARPKFVYTIPNFQNPGGVTLSLERRHRLIALCRQAGVPIVEDNPYGMLRFEGEPLPTLKSLDPENVIYVGSLSKVFAAGIRLGWAYAESGVLQRFLPAKEAADLCTSNLTQLIAEEWFASDRWRPNLATLVGTYRSRRDACLKALDESFPEGTSWTHPSGGFYVWVTVPDHFDTRRMLAAAVERRVAYVPGTAFYPDDRGTNQMRLAFCYPPEDAIEEGVHRLADLLADEEALYRSLSP